MKVVVLEEELQWHRWCWRSSYSGSGSVEGRATSVAMLLEKELRRRRRYWRKSYDGDGTGERATTTVAVLEEEILRRHRLTLVLDLYLN